ncbi:bifunctional [glutamate--ammonia ligase]-adenylyl-L-tyrosine phosphorylase/[glutamate--ammonia-ligase] adenylyltransferase [Candidatus Venteria ishoeyi]|uniref:Bifunctional glutamine synthetase adenylyltransferase/adenylyl-removing enzyme n=1 Tax=Candidatus Venteria ishoeyi TaxID=1899563 RepID=A0A1H6FD22_9GAMM|nr:bifunctional [glutamate--ammonia ligase]-adenylyl-L-tyrosine phosphorylase/[glutamate--ammonia-ligase] adenylyltransferase [Candidatus Venteria ishoeyi]SEH06915.1 Glutamate-ammonia-ligase adenylyltransferase [Candidatus Venteria ishoeyi]
MPSSNNTLCPASLTMAWQQAQHQCQEIITQQNLPEDLFEQAPENLPELEKVWTCSPFIVRQCRLYPGLLQDFMDSGDLLTAYDDGSNAADVLSNGAGIMRKKLQDMLGAYETPLEESAWMENLRQFRQREMVRIAWRDIVGLADIHDNLKDISNLADVVIQDTVERLSHTLSKRFGKPRNKQGDLQSLLVIGMGKLGGRELNFSSDIDLIYVFPENGETDGSKENGQRCLSNQEYFIKLGQKLIQLLNTQTAYGFVFRVDMRLRPFGGSGPMAVSFSAMEDYYQIHAREWERYALVKARFVTGSETDKNQLQKMLTPFIYRRYLDFTAFESLRDLKTQIDREVRRLSKQQNIKLGHGGIREIEFIVQVFQLLRGGREPGLQTRHLLTTLAHLQAYDYLPASTVEQLQVAYIFLRRVEHRIQLMEDAQTQQLPENETDQQRLVWMLGFADWDAFMVVLDQHRQHVAGHFKTLIAPEEESAEVSSTATEAENAAAVRLENLHVLWSQVLQAEERDDGLALQLLQQSGFSDPHEALRQLCDLAATKVMRQQSAQAQRRLQQLMPLLLTEVSQTTNSKTTLQHSLRLVEAITRRSVYLALLLEHPQALHHLIQLCSQSEWIAAQIIRYPLLLDELLDGQKLYDLGDSALVDQALRARLAHIPEEDLELQMDSLREFKRAQVLRVGAAELSGVCNTERASDYLSAIADSILRHSLELVSYILQEKHGLPYCTDNQEQRRQAGFCIIAYGKSGGIELSYSSDLDLVFLHDSQGKGQYTDGTKSIDNAVYFSRLVGRLTHVLSTRTGGGILYEIDPRLRPGGNSGLLVSSLNAFSDYQQNNAWTWEHQALIRARAVGGDADCIAGFEKIRKQILSQQRDVEKLKTDICDMRRKMRDNLDSSDTDNFDLKQGVGGIVDIEFMLQYGVLAHAWEYPQLLETTGMLPLLEYFQNLEIWSQAQCQTLAEAYRCYRAETHRLALQNQKAKVSDDSFQALRQGVAQSWQDVMCT